MVNRYSNYQRHLIHDWRNFSADSIRKKVEIYDFTQPTEFEVLIWNYELYGHLQQLAEKNLILKGGAAAQLYLSKDKQRASVDLDIVSFIGVGGIEQILKRISTRLSNQENYFTFRRYKPLEPEVKLPMRTYYVTIPSMIGQTHLKNRKRFPGREIKIDFFLEDSGINSVTLRNPKTLVLNLAYSPIVSTKESLIADKLLILATKSVGIPFKRRADIPKHVYDIDCLVQQGLDEDTIREIISIMNSLIEAECSYRGMSYSVEEVITHIVEELESLSYIGFSKELKETAQHIENFQSQYLQRSNFQKSHGWGIRFLRLRFLVKSILQLIQKEINEKEIASLFTMVCQIDARLGKSGEKRADLRKQLLQTYRHQIKEKYRFLKGQPPERILWEIISPENVEEIKDLII
ncbi:nucleotidyl transferase AbiEii/AbiGii toxin family protein [Candidatus Aerophobetes bacterium]|nr:nucleotidyl transferase AbiEii/AbiGii toxin family protein [Candidatus Aerophobetes bacterium]